MTFAGTDAGCRMQDAVAVCVCNCTGGDCSLTMVNIRKLNFARFVPAIHTRLFFFVEVVETLNSEVMTHRL